MNNNFISIQELEMNLNKYRNILPKKITKQPRPNEYVYYYNNSQILKIIEQYEITIQLLLQLYLFCDNLDIKIRSLNIINKFILKKNQIIFELGIPIFDVYLIDFKSFFPNLITMKLDILNNVSKNFPNISIQVSPQFSIYQSNKLELINLISEANKKNLEVIDKINLFKELSPIIDKNWIILKKIYLDNEIKIKKSKFNNLTDQLLLLGLETFGQKQFNKIKEFFIPDKSVIEIKNRYKNQIKYNVDDNIIKLWKIKKVLPLNSFEILNLEKAKVWFSECNIELIKKWFLPDRSVAFIKKVLYDNNSLEIERNNTNYNLQYYNYNFGFFELFNNNCDANNNELNIEFNGINDTEINDYIQKFKEKKFNIMEENNLNFNLSLNLAKIKLSTDKKNKNYIIMGNNILNTNNININNNNIYINNINYINHKKISKQKSNNIFYDNNDNHTYDNIDNTIFTLDNENNFKLMDIDIKLLNNEYIRFNNKKYYIEDGEFYEVIDLTK